MAKNNNVDFKLQSFPEEVTEDGLKIYGATSYENQMAVLSQFLHNGGVDGNTPETREKRKEIINAIRDFLEQKKEVEHIPEIDDDFVRMVAELSLIHI